MTPEQMAEPFHFDRDRDTWVCVHHGDQDYTYTVQCYVCMGEGGHDEHDEDPINYAPGEEWATCRECRCVGEFRVCPACNADNPDAEP